MPPRPLLTMDRSQPLPAVLADALTAPLGRLGTSWHYFESIGSTNDVAAKLAAEGREGAVVIADAQTAGRGRRGHSWSSPAGAGLYVSVVMSPRLARSEPERATALLTMMAGLAIADAVEQTTGLSPTIKWPNDLLVGRRKLAGILAEGVSHPASGTVQSVVLGYGLNVSPASYPPELVDRVTSIESELGRAFDRGEIFAATLSALARRYDDLVAARYDAILDAWRARAPAALGARVSFDTKDGAKSGVTSGVDSYGALLVRRGEVVERIVSGEVRWE